LLRTQEVLRRHLGEPPLEILDVGGASGVHARWLAADGHRVHVLDSVPKHVEQAAAIGAGVTAELGDARSLAAEDATYDVVLLFGPLYHLTEADHRRRALEEARRVVRPGGLVCCAAISRFASLFDGLGRQFLFDPVFRQ